DGVCEWGARRVGLGGQVMPQGGLIAALGNPSRPIAKSQTTELQAAAQQLGQRIQIIHAENEGDIDTAFRSMAQGKVGGLLVATDPFFNSKRDQIVSLATH